MERYYSDCRTTIDLGEEDGHGRGKKAEGKGKQWRIQDCPVGVRFLAPKSDDLDAYPF